MGSIMQAQAKPQHWENMRNNTQTFLECIELITCDKHNPHLPSEKTVCLKVLKEMLVQLTFVLDQKHIKIEQ